MLAYSDFDMKDIGRKKTAVFIVIQDEKKTYHALATIFIKQCYETLIDVAQENNGKLPIRTNFILDEFANMPPLRDVTTMITAARSRQIRFNLVIQNFAQLNQVYGADDAETIKGNCANLIYLMSKELKALEEISKLCGEKKIKAKSEKEQDKEKPLISVSELQRLKMGDAIVIKDRSYPLKTKLPDLSEYKFYEPQSSQVSYPTRRTRQIKLFDIKEKVKNLRMNAYPNNTMYGPGMFDPRFPGGMNPNPFIPPVNQPFDIVNNRPAQPNPNFFNNKNNMFNAEDSFNVDDLIKKIDAKIAELEAEEKREAEKQNNVSEVKPVIEPSYVPPTKVVPDVTPNEPAIEEPIYITDKQSKQVVDEPKVVNINPNIDEIINSSTTSSDTTDDQFLDDFFSDDEE